LTYKAIGFMGFDMHHAMSAEQEAKSALNRPVPIPLNRRFGQAPSAVLGGGSSGTSPASPTPSPGPKPGTATAGQAGMGGGQTAAAAGPVGVVATAATAASSVAKGGGSVGRAVGHAATQQAHAS